MTRYCYAVMVAGLVCQLLGNNGKARGTDNPTLTAIGTFAAIAGGLCAIASLFPRLFPL